MVEEGDDIDVNLTMVPILTWLHFPIDVDDLTLAQILDIHTLQGLGITLTYILSLANHITNMMNEMEPDPGLLELAQMHMDQGSYPINILNELQQRLHLCQVRVQRARDRLYQLAIALEAKILVLAELDDFGGHMVRSRAIQAIDEIEVILENRRNSWIRTKLLLDSYVAHVGQQPLQSQ